MTSLASIIAAVVSVGLLMIPKFVLLWEIETGRVSPDTGTMKSSFGSRTPPVSANKALFKSNVDAAVKYLNAQGYNVEKKK